MEIQRKRAKSIFSEETASQSRNTNEEEKNRFKKFYLLYATKKMIFREEHAKEFYQMCSKQFNENVMIIVKISYTFNKILICLERKDQFFYKHMLITSIKEDKFTLKEGKYLIKPILTTEKLSYDIDFHISYPENFKKVCTRAYITGDIDEEELVNTDINFATSLSSLKLNRSLYQRIKKEHEFEVSKHKLRGIWIYGKSGSGKTQVVKKLFENYCLNTGYKKQIYRKYKENDYFEHFDNELFIAYDDLNQNTRKSTIEFLKNLINTEPTPVNVKGSQTYAFPDVVTVTTNYPFSFICRNDESLMLALKDRFIFLYAYKTFMSNYSEFEPEYASFYKSPDNFEYFLVPLNPRKLEINFEETERMEAERFKIERRKEVNAKYYKKRKERIEMQTKSSIIIK